MNDSIEEICTKLRTSLERVVRRALTENLGILLSGGLDTSVLAFVASSYAPLKAFTVAMQGAPAPDLEYSALMAKRLRLEHQIHCFDTEEMYRTLPLVIKVLRSFDPMEIRNSLTVYIGIRVAKESGIGTVITGDGCDELLAGYSFVYGLSKEKLDLELRKLWSVMSFSSIPLAKSLDTEVKLPYLDPDFKSFSMALDSRYKVGEKDGQLYGKWILRKAYEKLLPREIVWRVKTPIEYGSGTTTLPSFFDSKISDKEFEAKKREYLQGDKVVIRDKEQLFYYEIYRSAIGVPKPTRRGRTCPQCNSNIQERATYCRTCGAYPI